MPRQTGSSPVEPLESNSAIDSPEPMSEQSIGTAGIQKQPQRKVLRDQGKDDQTLLLKDKPRVKPILKQLSFRVNETTHEKIERAAKKANKSINAWMEEILSEAADDALGLAQKPERFHSESIQRLMDDEDLAAELAEQLEDYLQEWNMRTVFKFNAALQRLLIGLDEVNLFQKPIDESSETGVSAAIDQSEALANLAISLLPFLPKDENPASVIRLGGALKKFIRGLVTIKSFLKDDQDENTCKVVAKIEAYLHDSRNSPS